MARILIVDDVEPIRDLLTRALTKHGHQCATAADAGEARKILSRGSFELVICDVIMPGESGLELIRYIHHVYPDTATLIISVMDNPEIAQQALDLGVYGYIVKPFDVTAILIDVESALRRRKLEMSQRQLMNRLEDLVAQRTKELEQEREEFESLVKTLPCVVYKGRKDWSVDFASDQLRDLTGIEVEEFISGKRRWKDLILQEDLPVIKNILRSALEGDGAYVREYRIENARGEVLWIQDRGQIVRSPDGSVDHVIGVLFDITNRKRIREELTKAKREWERTFEAVPDPIVIIDQDLKIRRVNSAFCRLVGLSPDKVAGRPCYRLLHAMDDMCPSCPRSSDEFDALVSSREIYNPLLRRHFHVTSAPLTDDDGSRVGCVSILRDITEQRESQKALEKAHRQRKELMAAIRSVLIGLDHGCRVIEWNPTAEKVFGIEAREVLGKELEQCPLEWEWERIQRAITSCRIHRRVKNLDDVRFTKPDGSQGFLGLSINPVNIDDPDYCGCLIMGADITERKFLESQLAQAQKLESIGQLAAGIAHEINTPTQFVGDNTRFLQDAFTDLWQLIKRYRDLEVRAESVQELVTLVDEIRRLEEEIDLEYLNEEIPKAIEQSLEGIARVAKIVMAMKEFSHPGMEEKVPTDINIAIENTITVARNEWKYVAEVESNLDPTLPLVPCYPAELNQVFLNIIINAAHAIQEKIGDSPEEKGRIIIETRHDDEWCEIRISDTGTGIPEEIRHRIFDPFFTTKEVGRGTGQGLAISHNVVVDKHGGTLAVESQMGRGTTFIIRLPLEDPNEVT